MAVVTVKGRLPGEFVYAKLTTELQQKDPAGKAGSSAGKPRPDAGAQERTAAMAGRLQRIWIRFQPMAW